MARIKAEGQAALKGKASLLHGERMAPATFGGWEKAQLARKTLTKLQAQRAVGHSMFKAPPPNVIIIPMNYMNHFLRLWCPHSLMRTIAPANPQNQRQDVVMVHMEAASQQAEVRPTGQPALLPRFCHSLSISCQTFIILHTAIWHLQSHYLEEQNPKFIHTKCPAVNCTENLKTAWNFGKPEAL